MITQKWEGYVHDIDLFTGEFGAVLRDLTDLNNPQEYATLRINDMPTDVQSRLQLGMIFNWTIEVDDNGNGSSTFTFSQEKWTAEEIADINKRAKEMAEHFGVPWNDDPSI